MKKSNVKIARFLKKIRVPKPWDTIVILLLALLILIPVFIILHQNLIDPEWPFHLDRILIFLAITVLLTYILRYIKRLDRKSTRLNSSHVKISYAVFCSNKKGSV